MGNIYLADKNLSKLREVGIDEMWDMFYEDPLAEYGIQSVR